MPAKESRKGKERERPGIIDLRLSASTSAMKLGDNKSDSPLRSRKGVIASSSGSSENMSEKSAAMTSTATSDTARWIEDKESEGIGSEDAPPAYEDAVNEYLLDPIQQFSAFPPVTLRNAQREFRLALEKSMAVLLAQRQFEAKCRVADEVHNGGKK